MNFKLLVARKQQKLTQYDLAAKAGVPQPDISRVESGWIPPADIQQRLADALGVSVDDLFAQTSSLAS